MATYASTIFLVFIYLINLSNAKVIKRSVSENFPSSYLSERQSEDQRVYGSRISKKVIGGTEAEKHDYPWHVGLYYVFDPNKGDGNGTGSEYHCGGSIINQKFILTAAHCLLNEGHQPRVPPERLFVVLGDHDRSTGDEADEIWMKVREMIPHEHFKVKGLRNDIGLVQLTDPIQFSATVQPICLPPPNAEYIGQIGILLGWGMQDENTEYENILREADIAINDNNYCKPYFPRIDDNKLCGGIDGNRSICSGDSGGSLVIPDDHNVYTIVGIVSYSKDDDCNYPSPHVYTKVSRFIPWINERIVGSPACAKPM